MKNYVFRWIFLLLLLRFENFIKAIKSCGIIRRLLARWGLCQ